jgi:hypothetical protein
MAVTVEAAKVVHGVPLAKGSGLFEPAAGFGVVLRNASAVAVEPAEVGHGVSLAQGGSLFVPAPGLGKVLRNTTAETVQNAKVVHGKRGAEASGPLVPDFRLSILLAGRERPTELVAKPPVRWLSFHSFLAGTDRGRPINAFRFDTGPHRRVGRDRQERWPAGRSF